jgi:signal transduction histidine kinase
VSDTGIGIRTEDLARLFEPFQQLDNPVVRGAGGTGLGLAISKKFVELHGGRIWAESRENHGSTFHFTLPLN